MAESHSAAADPHLLALADGIWSFNGPLAVGGAHVGHRMTVVQLEGGGLWLHSPVLLDSSRRAELDQLGPVEHLVAPSTFHDLYWSENLAAYPQARSYCAPALAGEHPELSFDATLGPAPEPAWAGQLDQIILAGMPKINEVVFLHQASGTLIVADAIFTIFKPANLTTKLILSLTGTNGKVAVSRLFRHFVQDATALRRSIDQVLAWDFDRLVVGHGQVLDSGAHQAFAKAFRFLD